MRGVKLATISVCLIIKDEELVLDRCLTCAAAIADEIIVVDTGSADRSKEIAQKYTNNIYDFKWIHNFAAARNFAFSKGTMDYLMWLDADDVMLPQEIEKFKKFKEELGPETPMVMLPYHTAFDMHGNPTFTYYRERIVRRELGLKWIGEIHEVIPPLPNALKVDIAIEHRKEKESDPFRNIDIFERMIAENKPLEPRQQYYYARELFYHGRKAEATTALTKFLDEGKGWNENNIEACRVLAECHISMGDTKSAFAVLFRSFTYDLPRAETLCDLGKLYMEQKDYKKAIYWYDLATKCVLDNTKGGFTSPDCYDYIPYLQMCVCYDRLGEHHTANNYNKKAAKIKPKSAAVLTNKKYFKNILSGPKTAQ